jgi:signal peptidase I
MNFLSSSLKSRSVAQEIIKVVVISVVTIIGIRELVFKPFSVEGRSMQPNFQDRQYLIIDELSYNFKEPARGEVVVFKYSDDYLIKRIIGLPGERVKIFEGKVIIYNDSHPEGVLLEESYLPQDLLTAGEKDTTLDDHTYYVLGDNRPVSKDSRYFGPISRKQIVGKVFFRGWPFDQVAVFKTPQFNYQSSSSTTLVAP